MREETKACLHLSLWVCYYIYVLTMVLVVRFTPAGKRVGILVEGGWL